MKRSAHDNDNAVFCLYISFLASKNIFRNENETRGERLIGFVFECEECFLPSTLLL